MVITVDYFAVLSLTLSAACIRTSCEMLNINRTAFFKQAADYYINHGSHVFACFIAYKNIYKLLETVSKTS